MDFRLTEEQQQLRGMVRDFAEGEVLKAAAANDSQGQYPKEIVAKLAELGLMGIFVPEEYGGAGLDTLSAALVLEEIARVCASTAVILSVHNSLVCEALRMYGTKEQKRKYLTVLASGGKLGAYSLTEPASGSDAAEQKTTAILKGDHYVVNGAKSWVTNGHQAGIIIFFAMSEPEKKHKGINAFILDRDTPGVTFGKDENKMGLRASSTCTISFDGAKVALSDRLGGEGDGFKIAMSLLDGGRIGIAAQSVGIAQAALDAATAFAKERVAFGQALSRFQGLRWMLSDMATDVEAARLLTWNAAVKKGKGERVTREASIAKLFASEAAGRVTDRALQIHGGYGYSREYPVERYLRDARVTRIYEGTSEIQRLVIATNVLKDAGG